MNQHPPKHPPVGIDLGTTYSVVAYIDAAGRPVTILNSQGYLLTPSAVFCDQDAVVVGREATRAAVIDPDAYAECFKRDMGSPVYHRKVRGVDVPPEVLSAFVLERLKRDAEQRLGPLRQVVITVPAFFDETRRRATQEAGRLAGWEVLDIINEPTAAAISFGYRSGFFCPGAVEVATRPMRVLVYDLGGGTFDVTILELGPDEFRALATDGDVQLGGKDWDERLVDHVAERFAAEHGSDPRSDAQDAAHLWQDAQDTKHALSERNRATLMINHAGIRMKTEITRERFEQLTRDLLERTETTTSLVVKAAGLVWSQIDRVLLVGGAVRMPMVPKMLHRVTGREPDSSESPDESVAHGAAMYAATLLQQSGDTTVARCRLRNINSHSLGVVGFDPRTRQPTNEIIIQRNTPIPCKVSRIFPTTKAGQRSVKISIVEGESHRPEECIWLGDCVVRDLPHGLPKGVYVHVEYSYAANGRIAVSARVPATRQSARVEIVHNQQRHLEDLKTWRTRLCSHEPFAVGGGVPGEPIDLTNQAHVIRRLDLLYIEVGKAAANESSPAALVRSWQAARTATVRLEQARTVLRKAQCDHQTAAGVGESVRFGSALFHAKTAFEQAQAESDFAHMVLGRDCVAAHHTPSQMARVTSEIQRLNPHAHGS